MSDRIEIIGHKQKISRQGAEILIQQGRVRWHNGKLLRTDLEERRPWILDGKSQTVTRVKSVPQRDNEMARQRGVYVLRASNGLYKIGQTGSLYKRITALWNESSDDFVLLAFMPTESHLYWEQSLHRTFCDRRTKGEWFALTDDDVKKILELPFLVVNKKASEFLNTAR